MDKWIIVVLYMIEIQTQVLTLKLKDYDYWRVEAPTYKTLTEGMSDLLQQAVLNDVRSPTERKRGYPLWAGFFTNRKKFILCKIMQRFD